MKKALHAILSLFAFLCCGIGAHDLEAAERSAVTPEALTPNQVETLRGAAAVAHLQNLKLRRSRAFSLAARLMEQRGFRPTNVVTVIRSTSLARRRASEARPEIQRVQTTVRDDSGEVVLWSWDDGNNATWEGVLYFEEYATGANFTGDAQIDISQDESVIWEQQVSYSSGGGGGGSTDKEFTWLRPYGIAQPVAQLAAISPDAAAEIARKPSIFLTQTRARVANFLICFSSRCYVHMMQCRWSGPYWADCSAGLCGIDAIICGIGALK